MGFLAAQCLLLMAFLALSTLSISSAGKSQTLWCTHCSCCSLAMCFASIVPFRPGLQFHLSPPISVPVCSLPPLTAGMLKGTHKKAMHKVAEVPAVGQRVDGGPPHRLGHGSRMPAPLFNAGCSDAGYHWTKVGVQGRHAQVVLSTAPLHVLPPALSAAGCSRTSAWALR